MAEVFPNLLKLEARGHWGIKLGLSNPRLLLYGLGCPEQGFPVVLVAGTNGKGSTGAYLAQALRASGLKVGWTTSPHLVSPRERIWVDGSFLEERDLDGFLRRAFAAEEHAGIRATYFELMIASAMQAFQQAKADIAIVEVGMGGRWDATNTLDPILTVLTNVAIDHTAFLGDTLEAIGREKLCTARDGRPLVLGPSVSPDWIQPLLECQPVVCPAPLVEAERLAWDYSMVQGHRVGMAGPHQMLNLSTALEALHQLRGLGLAIPEEAMWEGLSRTRWPGRLWEVPGLQSVWMDGAHNPDGAGVLAQHAKACGVRPHVFFGAMGDKDLSGIVTALKSMEPQSVTLLKGENERYASREALQAAWGESHPLLNIAEAATALNTPSEGIRLVTGSLFLIGDLLREMHITPQTSHPLFR